MDKEITKKIKLRNNFTKFVNFIHRYRFVVVGILLLILTGVICFGYYKYSDTYNEPEDLDQMILENSVTVDKVKLDTESTVVRELYRKVDGTDGVHKYWMYGENEFKNFYVNGAGESSKMRLVGANLVEDKIINVDDEDYYNRSYIEDVYRDLFGTTSTFDTSQIIYLDHNRLSTCVYDSKKDMYLVTKRVAKEEEEESGSFDAHITKAMIEDDKLKIYETVDSKDSEDTVLDTYKITYTFKKVNDKYYFYSRVVESK